MFRPLRRTKNAISIEETKALLVREKRGVLAVNGDDGYPFAFPINYFYNEEEGKIFFHGAKTGYKVEAIGKSDKVCFTVYGNEHFTDDWAPFVQSAVVYGRCRLIMDPKETEERVRTFAMKYYPSAEEVEAEIAMDIHAAQLYEITIEHMCGKQIHEK